jgi:two-component sensor histidine kinase
MRQKKFEKAKIILKESIDIAEKTNIPQTVMAGLSNLSMISIEENKLNEALAYAQKSLKLRIAIGSVNENASEYLRLASIYEKLNNTTAVLSNYNKAMSAAIETDALPQLSKVYEALHGYYKRQKKYKKGYEYLLKYTTVKDSLFTKEKHKQLKEVQAKFDIESKEQEVQLLTNENKIKTLENKNHQTIRIVLIAGMIALLVVLLTLFYAYRNKQKTNTILEEKNKEISQNLRDREILLKEVHHRVKNNLQIVSSLLRLQHKFGDDKSSVEILQEVQNKIQAMAIIHERLYKTDDLSMINFQTYLDSLLNYFRTSYDLPEQNITISSAVDTINLDMDYLVPCGLIVNEIIANSIKYAFVEDTSGHISIEASSDEDSCILIIKDTGVGFPEDFKIESSQSLGMQLIQGLTKQIKGTVALTSNPGACYTIIFDIVT